MDRTLYPATNYGLARVYCEFLFQCNNVSNPSLTTVQGVSAGALGAPPFPVIIALTRTGVGIITVQMSPTDRFNKVIGLTGDLDDTANDGAYATFGTVINEGSSAAGIGFTVRTRAAAGALTDFTARTVYCMLALRNTTAAPGAGRGA